MAIYFSKRKKTRPTLDIELLSISGRCHGIKELGNRLHEINKIHHGRMPCLEYKYDLLWRTVYYIAGALWISRASKALYLQTRSISSTARFATRKIVPTFCEEGFRRNARTSFAVFLFSRVFRRWTKVKIDFPGLVAWKISYVWWISGLNN